MSDQDFFFDEEQAAEGETARQKPAPSSQAKGKKAAERKTAQSKGASAKKPARAARAQDAPEQRNVSMTVAALMTVVGLLVGVIIGLLIPSGESDVAATTSPAANGGMTAPQLTEEQLESGELPEGHPPISGMTGSTGTTETTASGQ